MNPNFLDIEFERTDDERMNDSKNGNEPQWTYDPGDERHKHHWNHDYAGFVFQDGRWVGKCPNNMTQEFAETLLNEGIPLFNPRKALDGPNEMFNVHNGVIYRAIPTLPGYSFHGFPEIHVPKDILNQLLQRAEEKGCRKEVEKWLKTQYRKLKIK